MGRPKALLPWGGRTLVEHVVASLEAAVDEVVVVTSQELDLPPLAARVVRDDRPAWGPLAGLAVGLEAAEAPLAFAASTDAPHLSSRFVEAVLASGGAAAPVVDGFVQTLAAAYPTRAGAEAARRLLDAGRRRPLDLLEALDYRPLAPEELPDLDALRGFNTPADYLAAVAREEPEATAILELVGHLRSAAGRGEIPVPVGTLGEVLAQAPAPLEPIDAGRNRVAAPYVVSLGGRDFVRDLSVPIGPGERVILLDSNAGG